MAETRLRTETIDGLTVAGFKDTSILDVVTIQQIGRELNSLAAASKGGLVLDFADVRFLSSQALGVLVSLQRQAESSGAKVALCAIRPEIARIFKITNLDKVFRFFPTREEALAHIAGGKK